MVRSFAAKLFMAAGDRVDDDNEDRWRFFYSLAYRVGYKGEPLVYLLTNDQMAPDLCSAHTVFQGSYAQVSHPFEDLWDAEKLGKHVVGILHGHPPLSLRSPSDLDDKTGRGMVSSFGHPFLMGIYNGLGVTWYVYERLADRRIVRRIATPYELPLVYNLLPKDMRLYFPGLVRMWDFHWDWYTKNVVKDYQRSFR